ncbi:MAG TPA: gliding motility-associated ABC transporter permease subunit GldF [Flavobacteriales bacterium]|nr:gliding motility-associated ABC transporter permease subunit GldF [Flavobacteriales bacterium]HRO39861.1 gliding motility-associated ABC transporter permease subunit GldF [Flavobacteriales bacterium]HRP80556.1 gliding motility-associated ABC transporter permease subunit GldF [Flavobacteriales bacterium]HRQ86121.1 gliding motility-associated ABC transporter permease subunit GldF [Flavobacteriales bacterium]
MGALIRKEVQVFLGSLIGHLVIGVFLLITGLFLWVFPGNILDLGYADLGPLFQVAPWVFLFLVPAVTMRSFSEERRTGTMELLLTKPVSELRLVLSKYLAAVLLVVLALLPTLLYWYSIGRLAVPAWSLDNGAIRGSYIGLFFLASTFTAVGLFASALTENQIVAFLVAVFLCFILYVGFDMLADFSSIGALEGTLKGMGIEQHYASMSRGVIDLRDVLYFLGVDAIFIMATRTVLQSRTW